MNNNLDQLRRIVESAAALETEYDIPLPYVEAMRRMHGHLRPSTVLALIERVEAAEAAVQRVRELAEKAKASRHESTEFLHPLAILRALDGGEQE